VSQTISRGGPRSQIAIPAQGMIEFRDALTDLLEEFGTEDGGFRGELPEGRHIRVDNKIFYFDIGQNNRGVFMRISEVSLPYVKKSVAEESRNSSGSKSILGGSRSSNSSSNCKNFTHIPTRVVRKKTHTQQYLLKVTVMMAMV